MKRLRDRLKEGEAALAQASVAEARLDARLLLQHALGIDHAGLISALNEPESDGLAEKFAELITRRAGGEPVSRITGWREFYGLPIKVTPAVLDPRPDTELIVDRVLADYRNSAGPVRFADIGTGSGAIALAILANLPASNCVALDISAEALATAGENARQLGLSSRFEPVLSNYLEKAKGTFDFIVSNPPYIPASEIEGLSREVRDHDPEKALCGGRDGLDAYRAILKRAAGHLGPGGRLYLETGAGQCNQVTALGEANKWAVCGVYRDLAGIERVMVLQRG